MGTDAVENRSHKCCGQKSTERSGSQGRIARVRRWIRSHGNLEEDDDENGSEEGKRTGCEDGKQRGKDGGQNEEVPSRVAALV
jgi:hypothetical protein